MNFKEYVILEEDYDLFVNLDESSLDEVLGSGLKFLGGFGGNLISQTGRGIGNLGVGLGQGAYGLGQGALGALQMAGGGSKKGKETLGHSWSNIKGGAKKIARGAAQAGPAATAIASNVFTPGLGAAIGMGAASIIPAIRGAQAASEPLGLSGIYAPGSKNRNFTQDLLGLDSWDKPKQSSTDSRPNDQSKQRSIRILQSPDGITIPDEWYQLTDKLRKATSKKEWISIASEMSRKYPELYAAAKRKAKMLSKGRPSTSPSGQLRSGPGKVVPKGFPGL